MLKFRKFYLSEMATREISVSEFPNPLRGRIKNIFQKKGEMDGSDADDKVKTIRINSGRGASRTNMTIEQLASVNPVSRPHLDVLRNKVETIKYLPNSALHKIFGLPWR